MKSPTWWLLCGALVFGCGSDAEDEDVAEEEATSGDEQAAVDDSSRCPPADATHELSEYDTSGDQTPDVRKVFLKIGEGRQQRLVLVCRESDLNGDGTKDIVRYYTEEGRPEKEEADRNFDGEVDEITYFANGRVVRREVDSNLNGSVDVRSFFEDGKKVRAERDVAERSTPDEWRPDRWEYFENGRMIRVGSDLDGDGKVDRWDRDSEHQAEDEGV